MRKAIYLSQDKTNVVEAFAHVFTLIRRYPEFEWYALIDTVFESADSDIFDQVTNAINCYEGDPKLNALAAVAPLVVPMLDNDDSAHRLRFLLTHCSARPMLSFIATKVNGTKALDDFRNFYMVSTDDNQEMLLRFADTRVLPNLQSVLTADQWGALCRNIVCWYYIGRDGRVAECRISNLSTGTCSQLKLSNHQVDKLVELSYPDILMSRIVESMPEAIPVSIARSSLYKLIADAYNIARNYSIENEADIFSLAIAGCLTAGRSNEDVELHRLLECKGWEAGNLGDEMLEKGII